jgi:uncharacterized protein YodC (DUF2158 family)
MDRLGTGSIVRLRCGGPVMVAVGLPMQGGPRSGAIVCAWRAADGTPQLAMYPEIALDVLMSDERLRTADRFMGYLRDADSTTEATLRRGF